MKTSIFLTVSSLFALTVVLAPAPLATPPVDVFRNPIDLCVLPGGQRVLTANHASDSVSLVDLEQKKVVAEKPCGRKPSAVAFSQDGQRAAVSNLWSSTVTLFNVGASSLEAAGEIAVGPAPRGLVFSANGKSLFVAVAGSSEVIEVDVASKKVLRRWPAEREPRQLALSADGKWLAAACSLSAQVRVWNLQTGKLHWERTITDAFNLRGLAFTPDGQHVVVAHVVRRDFPVSRANIEEGWVTDSRLTMLALKADALPATWQIALDVRGQAVGDPHGLAMDAGGDHLVVTGSGTQEVLLLPAKVLPWNAGDPGDFLDEKLQHGKHAMQRVSVQSGRPLAIAFAGNKLQAVLANYLRDSVQIVDIAAGRYVGEIALGAPADLSPARKGEALFYDARRSHNHWFSCHTCHVDGHTCLLNFDTLNDATYGTPKLTPTLRNVTKTGPWTWHGWQKDLEAGIAKSFADTMFGPPPSKEEIKSVYAFLATLEHPPNPNRGPDGKLSAAAQRGKVVFYEKAHCIKCHKEPYYTSTINYDVKIEPDGSPYKLWNPPSLEGLYDRGPFMHDGRSKTLEELLTKHHSSELLGGSKLTAEERQDLTAFLLAL
jgi:YVTN family beta-propeller protein